jgi:TonB family protein
MNALCTENLAAYSIQVALVVAVGGLAAAGLRLKQPRVLLAYWQALLAAALLLPLLASWQRVDSAAAGATLTLRLEAPGAEPLVHFVSFQAWILPALGAGVGAALLRLAVGFWRLRYYRRTALPMAPWPDALREAQALAGVRAAFYLSDRLASPATFGWLKPAILLPLCFARMEESRQRAIACHELLHVARRDWLANLGEEIILTFFWFHPAVWWAVRSIRLAREQVVDCEVVALTGARKPYLHALLEIAAAPRALPLPAPLFLGESQLAQRVAALVKEVRMSKPRLIASLVVAVALLAAAGWWGVHTFRLKFPAGNAAATNGVGAISSSGGYSGPVYQVDGDVTAPVPIYKPEPRYTEEARAAKLEGTDVFAVVVDANGVVPYVRLTRSLSQGKVVSLDENAIQTLRTWKFKPALRKGKPVPVEVVVEVSFRMF